MSYFLQIFQVFRICFTGLSGLIAAQKNASKFQYTHLSHQLWFCLKKSLMGLFLWKEYLWKMFCQIPNFASNNQKNFLYCIPSQYLLTCSCSHQKNPTFRKSPKLFRKSFRIFLPKTSSICYSKIPRKLGSSNQTFQTECCWT